MAGVGISNPDWVMINRQANRRPTSRPPRWRSSAANLVAACRVARSPPVGARVLTFAYDGVHDDLDPSA